MEFLWGIIDIISLIIILIGLSLIFSNKKKDTAGNDKKGRNIVIVGSICLLISVVVSSIEEIDMLQFYLTLLIYPLLASAVVGFILLFFKGKRKNGLYIIISAMISFFAIASFLYGIGNIEGQSKIAQKKATLAKLEKKIGADKEERQDLSDQIFSNKSELEDISKQVNNLKAKHKDVMNNIKNKVKLEKEVSDQQSKLDDIKSQISDANSELSSINGKISSAKTALAQAKGQVAAAKGAPKTLSAGKYTVGKDVKAGRYKATPIGDGSNFIVYDGDDPIVNTVLGSDGEASYTFECDEGNTIQTESAVKLTPVK